MSEVKSSPELYGPLSPPSVIVHALKSNRRPIGFAPWPEDPKPKKKRKKNRARQG